MRLTILTLSKNYALTCWVCVPWKREAAALHGPRHSETFQSTSDGRGACSVPDWGARTLMGESLIRELVAMSGDCEVSVVLMTSPIGDADWLV